MDTKILNVRKVLKERGLSAIVLLNTSLNKSDPNINYFLGRTFEYCALVFSKNTSYLIVPALEYGRGKDALKNMKGAKLKLIQQRNFSEILQGLHIKGRIGLNFESITLSEHHRLKTLKNKIVDVSSELKDLRMQKTPHEIKNIKEAAHIADKILLRLLFALENNYKTKRFQTEKEVQNYLLSETHKQGLKTSFKPIVASGKNSAFPHHDSTGRLTRGFCIIDFGVKYHGYCSDMTRTIYFGTPNKKDTALYETVLEANNGCIEYSQAGKRCSEIDAHCKKILGKNSKYFIHGLGHGIGVEIHEGPTLNKHSKDILEDGMVFTIEPGVYIPRYGGVRIEDDVLVSQDGKEVLTKTTKRLLSFKI